MFGWIKRRLLARKARKAVASVGEWSSQCRYLAAGRAGAVPAYSPSPAYAPAGHGVDQVLLAALLLSDSPRETCSPSSHDYGSSYSSSDSGSSSCADSSSSSSTSD